jgi:FtsP/CotA-like multicopper oxidase with cupredoxin domain
MKKQWLISLILLVLILVIAGCSQDESKDQSNENMVQAKKEILEGKTIKEFSITAKKENWELKSGKSIETWTYNGSVPGQEIRVKEGEGVKVTIKNELPKPVSIHWHGVPLSNTQDGIPGVTQDAIETGKEYTYQFVADTPGTYWYHSHQDSVNQVDKGLYGVFIVESKDDEQYDRDYSLVLDEWESNPKQESEEMDGMDHSNMDMSESDTEDMEGMDHSNMDMGDKKDKDSKSSDNGSMEGMDHDMSSYDIYTINGKSYDKSKPLIAKKGEKVKLRFVNAGYMAHKIHIPLIFKVTNVDGQPVNQPIEQENKLLEVAPGERYDIEFIATGENITIDCHGEMDASKDMRVNIQAEEEVVQTVAHKKDAGMVKPDEFGKGSKGDFSLNDSFEIEYKMDLATDMDSGEMKYTINGNVYPKTENIKVDKGDKVKVTLTNKSMDKSDHPMHLHGHFFQVLSKNGKPLEGAPLMKDTLNVKPGETYEVAFIADNPGNWMFHCHDLHHASAGMMTMVKYNNFKPFYKDEGKVNNISE